MTTELTTELTTTEPSAYVPVWARPDNPTTAMTETEMRAYYKRTDLVSSLRFYLELRSIPLDLKSVYAGMLERLEGRKPTPADKALIVQVKSALANYRDGRPYVAPTLPAEPVKAARKRANHAATCPHCGVALAA